MLMSQPSSPRDSSGQSANPRSTTSLHRGITTVVRLLLLLVAVAAIRSQVALVTGASFVRSLASYTLLPIVVGIGLTAASFSLLALIELFALRQAGTAATRAVSRLRGATTGFIASAFGQSIGFSLLTGAAVRLRSYHRHNVTPGDVARVSAFATLTASLGLLVTGAFSLLIGTDSLVVAGYRFRLHWIGVTLAVATLAYLGWCGLPGRRSIGPRHWQARRPRFTVALGQLAISSLDWVLAGSVLFVLLPHGVASYPHFLPAFFVAQTMAVVSHVPGGLGVFEAVLLGILGHGAAGLNPATTAAALAAALLLYRVIYYVVPLVTAAGVATVTELSATRRVRRAAVSKPVIYQRTDPDSSSADENHGEDSIEWLIDNIAAYEAIEAAITSARSSISIAQLALDPDFTVKTRTGSDRPSSPFITLLTDSAREKDLEVKVLLNATLLLDTLKPLRRFMRRNNLESPRIELRGVSHFPQLLHAKFAIIDSTTAFLIGSPFVNGYWDSPLHRPVDTSRPMGELGGRPLHDVSVRLTGPVVNELEQFFHILWADAKADDESPDLSSASPENARPSNHPQRLLRSIPKGILKNEADGRVEILDELLRAISSARSLIYIEHQYLSSRRVYEALASALKREPDLEIIIVLNENPDITAYARWQSIALREFGLLDHPRVGLFALWSIAESASGGRDINQVFVHSKVVIIDDGWAMCGSANLDGVSLHSYADDFTGPLGRRIFRDVRSFEAAIVSAAPAATGVKSNAATLRQRLWAEHLGAKGNSTLDIPTNGSLHVWRAAAQANARCINEAAMKPGSFILRFSTSRAPAAQLSDCGVNLADGSLELRFNPGWVERQFSPRWMRNMFL